MNKASSILLIVIFLLHKSILFAQYKKTQTIDTLYYEDSSQELDSIQLIQKKARFREIEKDFLSKRPIEIVDGILINSSINSSRDSVSGKSWDGHCGCYVGLDSYAVDIVAVYFIKDDKNANLFIAKTKSDILKPKKRKRKLSK